MELNALVQRVKITDDRESVLRDDLLKIDGLSYDDAAVTPFLAYGTHDEIAEHLRQCRQRWGISYFSVRSIDEFQPVIERLRPVGRFS